MGPRWASLDKTWRALMSPKPPPPGGGALGLIKACQGVSRTAHLGPIWIRSHICKMASYELPLVLRHSYTLAAHM